MLYYEASIPGRRCSILPECDVPVVLPDGYLRESAPKLPELSENDISRHYTELAGRAHGVNDGFYPLGSCTMKYNPKIGEERAALPGFTGLHPLQDAGQVQGALEVLNLTEQYLCEITGTDAMSFQPAAGAHGEFSGMLVIKAYHDSRGDKKRTKIIVPDSAHGTNPASAAMAGFASVRSRVANLSGILPGCDRRKNGSSTKRSVWRSLRMPGDRVSGAAAGRRSNQARRGQICLTKVEI